MASYFWVFIEKFSSVLVRVLGMILLARILTPEDFGIFGMVAIFMSLSVVLMDSGMGGALIKKVKVSDIDYSTVFIFNMCVGLTLALILYNTSSVIASYYGTEEIEGVIKVLCISLIVKPLSFIQVVRLTKQLEFKLQTKIAISSYVLSLAVAYCLAIKGFGYWALIWQQVTEVTITSLLFFYFVRYLPKIRFSTRSFFDLIGFGSQMMLSSFIKVLYENSVFVILGKSYSTHIVGLYTQAYKINDLFIKTTSTIIDKASFPILVKFAFDETQFFNKSSNLLEMACFICFIPILIISLLSKHIIILTLGIEWVGSASILKILSLCGLGMIIESVTRSIIKSKGRADIIFKLEILKVLIALPMLIISAILGLKYILYALLIMSVISAFLNMLAVGRVSTYKFSQQAFGIFKQLLAIIITYTFIFQLIRVFSFNILIVDIMFFSILIVVIYVAISSLFRVKACNESMVFVKKLF